MMCWNDVYYWTHVQHTYGLALSMLFVWMPWEECIDYSSHVSEGSASIFSPVFRKRWTCCWIMKIKYPWVHLTALCLLIKATQTPFTGVSRCFILSCSAGGQSGWRAERQTRPVACGKQQLQQTEMFLVLKMWCYSQEHEWKFWRRKKPHRCLFSKLEGNLKWEHAMAPVGSPRPSIHFKHRTCTEQSLVSGSVFKWYFLQALKCIVWWGITNCSDGRTVHQLQYILGNQISTDMGF